MEKKNGRGSTSEAQANRHIQKMKNKKENSIRASIIIPCYNEEQGLLKTLKDIYKNLEFIDHFEIIAINDGSTDGTRKILVNSKASYDSLEIIENEKICIFFEFDSIDSIIRSIRSIICRWAMVDRPGKG